MRKISPLLIFFIISTLLTACGGDSDGGAAVLRRYQQGDSWFYDTQVFEDGQLVRSYTETKVIDGPISNPSGWECLQHQWTGDTVLGPVAYYYYQDEGHNLYYCGDSIDGFVTNTANNLSFAFPGRPQVGQEIFTESPYEQESGYRDVCSSVIVAEEDLEINGSIYHTFKVEMDCEVNDKGALSTLHSSSWTDLDIGMVRTEREITEIVDGQPKVRREVSQLAAFDLQ